MITLVTTAPQRVVLDGSTAHPAVPAGPGGLAGVGGGLSSATAWVEELREQDVRGGGSS